MRVRRQLILALVTLVAMACQSGTTTTEEQATTTRVTEETSDPGSVSNIGEIPAECLDAFRTYLRAIEPIVEDFDFQSATMTEFEALSEEIADATEGFEEQTEACPELDVSAEESLAIMREFAENEAPGTVGYFTFIEQFAGEVSTDVTSSGDCETDIAAVQEYVDRGGTMNDLTFAELAAVGNLMGAISTTCSVERAAEFFEQPDVAAWIDTSG